jgi:RNA polymerase sigma factor (sigma-70 family)
MSKQNLINSQIEQWRSYIYKLAYYHQNTISDVEDLRQEATAAIIEAVETWDPKKGSLDRWAGAIIHNRVLAKAFTTSFPTTLPSGSFLSVLDKKTFDKRTNIEDHVKLIPDSKISHKIHELEIRDAIDVFDRDEIGKRYFLEGETYEEISRNTGISASTISRHISNLRHRMRTLWIK